MIQSDMTVLLEVHHPDYSHIRDVLSRFAELEKSPEHVHTYRITPLSLWNAASSGRAVDEILDLFVSYSKFDIAPNVTTEIRHVFGRFGVLKLESNQGKLVLSSREPRELAALFGYKSMGAFIDERIDACHVVIRPLQRGRLKQELMNLGHPVQDLAGYTAGAPLDFSLRKVSVSGHPFALRKYQQEAVDHFYADGSSLGGSGVLVLPCGAGKTVIGLGAAVRISAETLIMTSSVTAARQWMAELLDKTTLTPDQIGEYSGEHKAIRPVTVATYQIVSHRKKKDEPFTHLDLFAKRNWGLIIYDEVHLLPAPVFRITADIQAKRRLGLTATLVREDGLETDVFSLIGPKKYDVPWKELEKSGWIATANCEEIRVSLTEEERLTYAAADARAQMRLSAEAEQKLAVVQSLAERHRTDSVLVIGQYLDQLQRVAKALHAPIITGKTPMSERDALYQAFRDRVVPLLVVSKVANFAIDLPDANVAVQISGQFGSRQEEAQRLGRILRPKALGAQAYFYSVVTKDTKEQDFALNRQRFLTEQGYGYAIKEADELLGQPLEEPSVPVVSLDAYRKQKAGGRG
ncbi:MAG: DNA repair helicase XPB [Sporolactobacillus sp.]